ncbi:MAG TPA: amidase family protein [Ramlibacter sp.]|nr:amidase family protein [Ramlibacter sp.]
MQTYLTEFGAARLAAHIASGEATATEAVEQHIARLLQVDPQLNAMTADRFEAARIEARQADVRQADARRTGAALGPLHGVPITVKECLDLRGMASTFGLPSRASHRADADETHVARLRAAGAIPIAKSNVAQALFYYESDNPVYGRTLNPWNADRTPGGSSGGEAALIATGASALGLGTDIGGSVRVPAAFCGIASLKPTSGRCDEFGRFSIPLGQRAIPSQAGVLARHVEDVALGLEVINGGARPEVPGQPLGDFRSVRVAGLRVAVYTDDGTFTASPAVARAVREAADMLRAAGAQVSNWTPPDARHAMNLVYGIFGGDGLALLKKRMGAGRRMPPIRQLMSLAALPRAVVPPLRALLASIGQPTLAAGLEPFGFRDTAHYWELVEAQHDYAQRFAAALDNDPGGPFDIILCPPCALPALTHGATKDLATVGAYACLYNLLGYPAGVVPVSRVRPEEEVGRAASRDVITKAALKVERGSAGLPVGAQVVARPWREHVALAAMAAIEQAARARPDFPQLALAKPLKTGRASLPAAAVQRRDEPSTVPHRQPVMSEFRAHRP